MCPFHNGGNIVSHACYCFVLTTKCNIKVPGNSQVMQHEAWDAAYFTDPGIEPDASPPGVDSPGAFEYFQQLLIKNGVFCFYLQFVM